MKKKAISAPLPPPQKKNIFFLNLFSPFSAQTFQDIGHINSSMEQDKTKTLGVVIFTSVEIHVV